MFSFLKKMFNGTSVPEPEVETVEAATHLEIEEVHEAPVPNPPVETDFVRRLREKQERHQAMLDAIKVCEITPVEQLAPKLNLSSLESVKYSTVTKKTNLDGIGNFVAIDTETTGLRVTDGEIIEVAAVRFRNFIPVEKFSTLLSTKKPIPEAATKVNGITDEMVVGYPHFRQIAAQLQEFIGSDALVGHNLPFDLGFLVKNGVDVAAQKRKYYDTLEIAQKTLKKPKMKWDKELNFYTENLDADYDVLDHKLNSLCFFYGVVNMEAHRAEGDAIAAGLIFQKLIETRLNK